MSSNKRTEGEKLFERYLASQDIPFEFEKKQPGKSKLPDYSIEWRGKTVLFDVKDFAPPDDLTGGSGAFDPYPRIREKIEQGRDKFREFKNVCCALVLCNLGNPFVMLQDAHIMLGAMYGDSGFSFPVNVTTGIGDDTKLKRTFLNNGKMIRPQWSKPQNTTIAALITLSSIRPHEAHEIDHYSRLINVMKENRGKTIEEYEAALRRKIPTYDPDLVVPRVIVWHNAFARIPLPDDLFCGPFDSHLGVARTNEGLFQEVTFRGVELPESVKL